MKIIKRYTSIILLLLAAFIALVFIVNSNNRTIKEAGTVLNKLELTEEDDIQIISIKDISNKGNEEITINSADYSKVISILNDLQYNKVTVYKKEGSTDFDRFLYSLDILVEGEKYSLILTSKEIIWTKVNENSKIERIQLSLKNEQSKILINLIKELIS